MLSTFSTRVLSRSGSYFVFLIALASTGIARSQDLQLQGVGLPEVPEQASASNSAPTVTDAARPVAVEDKPASELDALTERIDDIEAKLKKERRSGQKES